MVSLACFRISHDIDPRGENAAQDEGASTPWCQGDTALSCKVVKFKNDREALAFVRAVAPRDAFGRREGPAWRQVREMSADLMIRGDQRVGHAASKSALNMSAVPPIAPELVCRNELTRCATSGQIASQQIAS